MSSRRCCSSGLRLGATRFNGRLWVVGTGRFEPGLVDLVGPSLLAYPICALRAVAAHPRRHTRPRRR